MASQSKDDGDLKSPEGISHASSTADSGKSVATRGLIFSDLGEAHRKITARQASGGTLSKKGLEDSPGRDNLPKTPGSSPSDCQPVGLDTAKSQNASSSKHDTPIEGMAFMNPCGTVSPEVHKSDMHSPKEESNTLANVLEQKVAEPTTIEPFNDSGNTVEKILDQYGNHPISRPDDSLRQQGVATRCGFRGEEARRQGTNQGRFQAGSLLSNPPQGGLPSTPRHHRRSRSVTELGEGSPSLGESTVSDSQHLLDPDAHTTQPEKVRKPFFPSPLHLPLKRNAKKPELHNNDDFFDASEASFDTTTNGSNNDPFRYDRHNYEPVLRPSKERDVSRALKRASKLGGGSEATMITPEGSPYISREPMPDIPYRNAGFTMHGKRSETRFPVRPDPQAHQIKVFINGKLESPTQAEFEPQKVSGLTRENIKANNQLDNPYLHESTAEGDWVTEVTSNGDPSFAEPADYQNIGKITGSSVADYSDTSEGKWTGMLGSCRRGLQRPVGQTPAEGYELQDLRGVNQSIPLPKTRPGGVGVGVFRGNSNRMPPTNFKEGHGYRPSRPPLSRGLSNPFGNNYRRADHDGNFSFNLGRTGPSKYDFRDSMSEYSTILPRDQTSHLQLSGTHETLAGAGLHRDEVASYPHGDVQHAGVGLALTDHQPRNFSAPTGVHDTPYRHETRLVDEDYPARYDRWWNGERGDRIDSAAQSTFSGEPVSVKSKFTFELIPLEEAQIKNKLQRESGETDETEAGKARYLRTGKPMPPIPPGLDGVQLPKPIYARRGKEAPQLSIDFSPTSRQSYQAFEFRDTPSPFSATTRRHFTPASSRPLLRQESTPTTAGTDNTSTSFVKRILFKGNKSKFLPPKKHDSKHSSNQSSQATTRTVIHNGMIDNESGLSLGQREALIESGTDERGRERRKHWFWTMTVLSAIFPFFIGIPIMMGKMDNFLSWYAGGGVRCLTITQRNIIRNVFLFQCCLYTLAVSCIVAVFVKRG